MGFKLLAANEEVSAKLDNALLHRMGCQLCPLNKVAGNLHPQMPPSGAERPLIYVLGEAPGKQEDEEGVQFIGASGQLLRDQIPKEFKKRVRYNNVVRTRPFKNKTPERIEIECCRPSIIADIEESQPKAIFGFGNVPLAWVSGMNGISYWRGRRMPVRIGAHACWYYPMLHPAFLLRNKSRYGISEEERVFSMDIERALAEVEDLPPPLPHSPATAKHGIEIIANDLDRVLEVLDWAARQPAIGLDYETTALRPYGDASQILTAAISDGELSYAFPFEHPGANWTDAQMLTLADAWMNFLCVAAGRKIVHNLAFEMEWSGRFFDPKLLRMGRWEDTASQACILDERKGKTKPGCFSLEFLVQMYFGFNVKKVFGVNRAALINQPLDQVLEYNALDAKYHKLLYDVQAVRIAEEELEPAYELALRRIPTVILSQLKGAPVDQAEVKKLQAKYESRIDKLEAEFAALPVVKQFQGKFGREFNPYSNPEVVRLFTKVLDYTDQCQMVDKYTRKTRDTCDDAALKRIIEEGGEGVEPATVLSALRKANKRKSTYIDPLDKSFEGTCVHADGLIHAQFNTIFAETGRLSCNDPNLQNFPKREDEAKEVRKPIQPPPGHVIMAVDYGQIEARVIAMFTKDASFTKALWERYDVHMDWAKRIAESYPERIGGEKMLDDKKAMKDFRTDIKNQWTFPLFFGAQLESAAGYLNIPVKVLKPHYEAFWQEYAGVKEWQEKTVEFYERFGYVECLTGRRRRAPLSHHQIINSPIQGTAAEIVMDAMSRLSETGDPELQPEINIHDDLTWLRVPEDRIDEIARKALGIMLDVPFDWVNVPISVELATGYNWMDMTDNPEKGLGIEGAYFSDDWFK